MVYEEFADDAEFFTVQLDRPYRKAFLRWLLPIIAKPISLEFCEVVMGTGDIETGEAGGACHALPERCPPHPERRTLDHARCGLSVTRRIQEEGVFRSDGSPFRNAEL